MGGGAVGGGAGEGAAVAVVQAQAVVVAGALEAQSDGGVADRGVVEGELDVRVDAGGAAFALAAVGGGDGHGEGGGGRADGEVLRGGEVDAQVGEDELVVGGDAVELVGAGESGLTGGLQEQEGVVVGGAQLVVAVVGVGARELGRGEVAEVVQREQVGEEHLAEGVAVDEGTVDRAGVGEARGPVPGRQRGRRGRRRGGGGELGRCGHSGSPGVSGVRGVRGPFSCVREEFRSR